MEGKEYDTYSKKQNHAGDSDIPGIGYDFNPGTVC